MFYIRFFHLRVSEEHKDWSQAYPLQWRFNWGDYKVIAETDISDISLWN